ncbi:MAG: GNAT family N-acetyltransferase [Oscillospiraceae bacterium]|jgi:ribosomal protein S18 acetylase RimI-like enzyme|nr:GNAT family N-acetyltransferase [Oscillospiraceae bacterium]
MIMTKRLSLTLGTAGDLPALAEIIGECNRYFAFDPPSEDNHDCPLEECLTTGDIPPGVAKEDYRRENYYFYCIRQGGALIGFLSYYLGYRRKDTAYLSVLYIKEACRANGLGAEILEALTRKLAAAGFKTIQLHCSLRNALSLRFWVKNGFDHITEVECTGNLYPGEFGGLGLRKTL